MNPLTSPGKQSDQDVLLAIIKIQALIIKMEGELSRDSPNLSYMQIRENVGDINRMKNRLRAFVAQAEARRIG